MQNPPPPHSGDLPLGSSGILPLQRSPTASAVRPPLQAPAVSYRFSGIPTASAVCPPLQAPAVSYRFSGLPTARGTGGIRQFQRYPTASAVCPPLQRFAHRSSAVSVCPPLFILSGLSTASHLERCAYRFSNSVAFLPTRVQPSGSPTA